MIEVIDETHRVRCYNCQSLLEYKNEDMSKPPDDALDTLIDWIPTITCPKCKRLIPLF